MYNQFFKTAAAVVVMVASAASVTPAHAEEAVMFNYQGRVKVHGVEFQGSGQFKFAILSPDKKSTLWSNDSTSVDGSEPSTGLSLDVADGVFNVVMGTNGVMDPINATIFQNRKPLKLRTWFNDGINGFQQLNPDYNLINVNLITSETGGDDFTIYVNGTTGDDSNSGLKPTEAKKTIQGGVDIVPQRVMANVTIDVADGVYKEEVSAFGIAVQPGKKLRIVGDESWTTASVSAPTVIISGQDGPAPSAPKVREYGLKIAQTTGIQLDGIGIQGVSKDGISVESSVFEISDCMISNCGENGLICVSNSYANATDSTASNNGFNGFYYGRQSSGQFTDCKAIGNGQAGFRGNGLVTLRFLGASATSLNQTGLLAQHNSSFVFTGKVQMSNNTMYGLSLMFNSYTENFVNAVTSQANGNSNQPFLKFGSNIYEF